MSAGTDAARPRPRVGLIGAGGISRVHVDGWLALGAEITVFSHEGAQQLAAEYGISVVDRLEDLWPLVDVVDIVAPTSSHPELAHAAIGQGKHVVCEKPLARSAAEAAEITYAAERAGVRLFPAHVVRYFPEYQAARAAVRRGEIGRVAVCRFRRVSEAPAAPWFFDEAVSGGIIMDQMIHDLDQAEWIAGPVVRVTARSRTMGEGRAKVASAHVVLEHEGGAISLAEGVWGHPGLPFATAFDLSGDLGVLRFDSSRTDATRVRGGANAGGYIPSGGAASPYSAEIADFWAAISSGSDADVDAVAGIRAVRIAEAALESIATGSPVELATDEAVPESAELEGARR